MRGTFQLQAGQTLNMMVGQMGSAPSDPQNHGSGGGGGTFVTLGTTPAAATPLIVAAGGGGGTAAYQNVNQPGKGGKPPTTATMAVILEIIATAAAVDLMETLPATAMPNPTKMEEKAAKATLPDTEALAAAEQQFGTPAAAAAATKAVKVDLTTAQALPAAAVPTTQVPTKAIRPTLI